MVEYCPSCGKEKVEGFFTLVCPNKCDPPLPDNQVWGRFTEEGMTRQMFTRRKGRKDYKCEKCENAIPKGTIHYTYNKFPGTGRVHEDCFFIVT